MKKIVYLCSLMLLCMNGWAQVDFGDGYWEVLFDEEFSGIRSWDNHWDDTKNEPNYNPIWRCFSYCNWASGVTTENKHYQAFRPDNAVWGDDQTMKLKGEFVSNATLICGEDYDPAPWIKYCHYCDNDGSLPHEVHYFSGMMETIDPVGFGYYEMECKMPVHDGANSTFWFWSTLGGTYNEIDVFEHCTELCKSDIRRETLSGIWYNPTGTNYGSIGDIPGAQRKARSPYIIPTSSPDLEQYHRFGCLWLPDKVEFYIDGEVIGGTDNPNEIPQFPMWLKVMHLEDEDAKLENNCWLEVNDEMTVNYVKAYYLKTDCDTDVAIRTLADFNAFVCAVKHSIALGSLSSVLSVPATSNFTMRAVESITIDGGFEVPIGSEMTLITQPCPECSMDGVALPNYNCGLDDE